MFIPKCGKNPYRGPRDFRLISLTSLLFKTTDRLVQRFLRYEILAIMPLYPNQHAYQGGKSVETDLHQFWVRVEKELDLQETALGVFFYKEKAFNNTSYDSMCAALFKHGVDYTIIWWIRATLEGCMAAVTLGGRFKNVAVFRRCPQGGVLSPLLWCLVADDLIGRLNGDEIYTQGYVDDICLLLVGKFLNTLLGHMQYCRHVVRRVWVVS